VKKTSIMVTSRVRDSDSSGIVLLQERRQQSPTRFIAPDNADTLADALVAGQLSERTRKAYASDLAELIGDLESWRLGLRDVTKDHLHAYRAWLAGEDVPGLEIIIRNLFGKLRRLPVSSLSNCTGDSQGCSV